MYVGRVLPDPASAAGPKDPPYVPRIQNGRRSNPGDRQVEIHIGVRLIRIETLLEYTFGTARSSLPSLLKSPAAAERGPLAAPNVSGSWKVPALTHVVANLLVVI